MGIEALRRLLKGADLNPPSWTITWFEIEHEKQVGFGSFNDVFRGTWREHTVAIKVLDKTTPPKIFLHEVNIWKSLYHRAPERAQAFWRVQRERRFAAVPAKRGSLFPDHSVSMIWFLFY